MTRLKEIRSRIASIKNTRQVTSAMKMVSAAKLKKAQDAILRITPYDKKLHHIVLELSKDRQVISSVYYSTPEIKKALIVVVGSNRGLCGAFNSIMVKTALSYAINQYLPLLNEKNVCFLPVGKQVEKGLNSRGVPLIGEANDLLTVFDFSEISKLACLLMEWFRDGKYQKIDIVYNKFKNAAVQLLTTEQFLPVYKNSSESSISERQVDYIFEPSRDDILTNLVPQSLKMHLCRILLDSNAAEQGARMTAMHQATDNATELLRELRTSYNNARQAAITNEILEITAGAEALKG